MRTKMLDVMSKLGRCACVIAVLFLAGGCGWLETSDDDGLQVDDRRRPTPETLHSMARILAAQGRSDEAVFVLSRLLSERPDFRPAYSDLADLHMRAGRSQQAVTLLMLAVDRWPKDPVLQNNLGMCYIGINDPGLALQHFSRAAELAPGHATYQANRAVALGLMGQYDEALAAYQQILPAGEAHYNLAVLAEARGDADRAQQEYANASANGYKNK